jgi:DNA repair protein RadC
MEKPKIILPKASEIELIYKSEVKPSERPKVVSSKEAYDLFLNSWNKDRINYVEEFKGMYITRENRVLAIYEMTIGTTSAILVDAKQVFTAALKLNASGIILCHNHPSGSTQPTEADYRTTKDIAIVGKFLGIPIIDALIITEENFFSFSDETFL